MKKKTNVKSDKNRHRKNVLKLRIYQDILSISRLIQRARLQYDDLQLAFTWANVVNRLHLPAVVPRN